jgi:hypothetical protein
VFGSNVSGRWSNPARFSYYFILFCEGLRYWNVLSVFLKLFTLCILNQYFYSMSQIRARTIHYITVTLLRHVSARQSHLQGVHSELKTFYSRLDYINEFHNFQFILLLLSCSIWIKCLHFLMYCRHYICPIIISRLWLYFIFNCVIIRTYTYYLQYIRKCTHFIHILTVISSRIYWRLWNS